MSKHQHPQEIIKQICDQMGADLHAPACREVAEHLKKCPDCQIYFNTVKKTVTWCRDLEEKKNIPPEIHQRLLKKLHLNKNK